MDTIKPIAALNADNLQRFSDLMCVRDADGKPVLMVGLSATFFFLEPWLRPAREAVSEIAEEYLKDFGDKLKWIRDHRSDIAAIYPMQRKHVPLPGEWIPNNPDDAEWEFGIHGGETKLAVSEYQIEAFGKEKRGQGMGVGFLHFHLPLRWLADHPGDFQRRVLRAAQRIKPLSGYAGIGFLQPVSINAQIEAEAIVARLAPRFPGIEVNGLTSHSIWCDKRGIKGVNWLTILSDYFVEQAGGYDYLRIRLPEPLFPFYNYDGGLIIQAGPHPEVGDATQNRWPQHYVTLAKVLKKIQIKEHRPFHFGGQGRMDKAQSEAWLFRFDGK